MHKNSWDLLRLVAATMVLYSHQYALLGLAEPSFMGLTSFGAAGLAIFFFLSGYLVWSSWQRDPNTWRFFMRRSLRIFPALWVVCLLSVFVLGPLVSSLPVGEYFASSATWRYLETGLLNLPKILPGVFSANAIPLVVNGSLWTLPLEFSCYVSVAIVGLAAWRMERFRSVAPSLCLLVFVVAACYGSRVVGDHYAPHFEMAAMFWWGVFYGSCITWPRQRLSLVMGGVALMSFAMLGDGSLLRLVLLLFIGAVVHVSGKLALGANLTDAIGDLSYGVYIMAFPVQQLAAQWSRQQGWDMATYLSVSLVATYTLAYLSWHCVEKRALQFKPTTAGFR